MATLTYKHFGNPGRCLSQAHYKIVHKESMTAAFFHLVMHEPYGKWQSRRLHAAVAGSHGLAAAFFLLHVCNIRHHRYLHGKFQEVLPKK